MANYIDLMAKRFGKLLVIDGPIQRKTKGGQSKTAWLCLCDCGNKVQRDSQQLRANQSTHCGCNKKLPAIKHESLIGQKFGRLKVIEESDMIPNGKNGAKQRAWKCLCDCGKLRNVRERMLKTGRTKSCGCLSADVKRARAKPGRKANGKVSTEYQAWRGMKTRCLNSNHPKYYLWGGRGVKICEEWINDFDAFLDHIGPKPSPEMSIDRIDVNGNYEPGNVRWATPSQQSLNRRPYKRRA